MAVAAELRDTFKGFEKGFLREFFGIGSSATHPEGEVVDAVRILCDEFAEGLHVAIARAGDE